MDRHFRFGVGKNKLSSKNAHTQITFAERKRKIGNGRENYRRNWLGCSANRKKNENKEKELSENCKGETEDKQKVNWSEE